MVLLLICIIIYFGYFVYLAEESSYPKISKILYIILTLMIFLFINTGMNLLSFYLNPYKEKLYMVSINDDDVKFYKSDTNHIMSHIDIDDIKYVNISKDTYSLYEIKSFENNIFFINTITNYELTIPEGENKNGS